MEDDTTIEVPDVWYEQPNMFDREAFEEWREECPDEFLHDDYDHLEKLRIFRDQLVEETLLSEREAEVAILRSEGYSYEDIGHQLNIGDSTAGEYMDRARDKVEDALGTVRCLNELDDDLFLGGA